MKLLMRRAPPDADTIFQYKTDDFVKFLQKENPKSRKRNAKKKQRRKK